MTTTITFETQEAVTKLRAVGVSQEHVDAFILVIVESQDNLITETDLELALNL